MPGSTPFRNIFCLFWEMVNLSKTNVYLSNSSKNISCWERSLSVMQNLYIDIFLYSFYLHYTYTIEMTFFASFCVRLIFLFMVAAVLLEFYSIEIRAYCRSAGCPREEISKFCIFGRLLKKSNTFIEICSSKNASYKI